MGLVDIVVVIAVLLGFGYIILAKMRKTNPRAVDTLKSFFPGKITQAPDLPSLPDKMEPIYREKRSVF